jgi:hypothetical protein
MPSKNEVDEAQDMRPIDPALSPVGLRVQVPSRCSDFISIHLYQLVANYGSQTVAWDVALSNMNQPLPPPGDKVLRNTRDIDAHKLIAILNHLDS